MNSKIVVIGSSNIDFIMKMERLPEKGETVSDAVFMQTFGGKGANQAVAAARAGGETWFVSCLGDDALAPALKANLAASGVRVEHVFEETGINTGAALVMVGQGGMNYISVAPGANYSLTPNRLASLASLVAEAALVVVQYEILPETLYAAIDLAAQYGVPVMFNLAPARPFDPAYLPRITTLVVNETEAQSLCGIPVETPEQVVLAAGSLLETGVNQVVLTLGANGVYLARPGLRLALPAFHVQAVDTTAAGDAFCGALAVALVEGLSLPEAARFASAAAAISVTRLGAQPSIPTRSEIDQFLQERK